MSTTTTTSTSSTSNARPGERAFSFLPLNQRQAKPRTRGITEMRGPYYAPMGANYLTDILSTMGQWVDILKFSGGSFSLMPRDAVAELISIAHDHDVAVSTGGFMEWVLTQGPDMVHAYLDEAHVLGFDIVEISSGFITIPDDDLVRLTERVQQVGMKAKPEINIQFGAGGDASIEALEAEGTQDPGAAIRLAQRHLDAGAYKIMVESEGITENVRTWRTDAVAAIAGEVGLDKLVFEAADPAVFQWYIKNYGPEVNLFVDHSQVVQLETLRSGIWGESSLFGRVLTYKGDDAGGEGADGEVDDHAA